MMSKLRVFLFSIFWVHFFSPGFVYAQSADTSSVEWIEVYFNMPGDHSVAKEGNILNDEVDLMRTLIDLIEQSKYSIDLATYNVENLSVVEALVEAAERGVRVRIATDHYNRIRNREIADEVWSMLRDAGIYSIDDAGEIYMPDGTIDTSNRLPGASYDMHHKFAVIDILSDDPDDYYVWTGSMNLTYTGPINSNNTIVVKDSGIAKAYHREFNELWGGDGDIPDSGRARFHKDKRFIGESIFYVDTTKVELYFSPINRDRSKPSVAARLNELILEAEHDVNFLAFAITPGIEMSRSMWRRSFSDGIVLQGLIDPRFYAQYRNTGAIWATPEAQAGTRNIRPARELRTLHHKILLLDVTKPFENENGIAVAGSYNFSNNAEENNDENTLIIHSPIIANQYYQDFMGAMNRATGDAEAPVPHINEGEWYNVMRVDDGSRFEIEISRRFGYPVRFLGVNVPRMYAGRDSSEFYADKAAEYLSNLLSDKQVRVYGPGLEKPDARYGAYIAYVQAKDEDGNIIDVNKNLLQNGYGEWIRFYRQTPDSVRAFQAYTEQAKQEGVGKWQFPDRVGERVPRYRLGSDGDAVAVSFPININTADAVTLQALNGIGPAISARIVEHRLANGEFRSIDDLTNVNGIGPATLERMRPYITVD